MDTTNAERQVKLQTLVLQGQMARAERLVFEWVKTGVFAMTDLSEFVRFCLNARPV